MLQVEQVVLHELSQGLPLVSEPYRTLAEKLWLTENEIFSIIDKNKKNKTIRRLGPVAQHRQFGYDQNAMVVFEIKNNLIEKVGLKLKTYAFVTLCYQRRAHPQWPYNLYCMIHGKSRQRVEAHIQQIQQDLKADFDFSDLNTKTLFSTKLFKQTGANYLGSFLADLDKTLINELQSGIEITERPFKKLSEQLQVTEELIVSRIHFLKQSKKLSRFGPLYNVEAFGGKFTLVAMHVPQPEFDEVNTHVNSFKEVAHNYEREHFYNMWFVTATETPEQTDSVLQTIANKTGLVPVPLPKLEEYFLSLRLDL